MRPKSKSRTPKRSLLVLRPKSKPERKPEEEVHEIAQADPYGGIAEVLASSEDEIALADPYECNISPGERSLRWLREWNRKRECNSQKHASHVSRQYGSKES